MAHQFLPILITLVAAGVFAVALIGSAALLGQRTRHRAAAKKEPYESGMPLLDPAFKRISVKFYLVAFLYPWAVNYGSLSASGSLVPLYEMLAFLALLAVAYAYLWRKGVFDWSRRRPASGDGHDS
jgi:NADH:ubiquinone oxidoreductase subunit 3 (subunit A)